MVQIAERDFSDFIHNTMSYIHATNDISVMIYPHEIGNGEGDAFILTIHGINQYLSHYDFVVPKGFTHTFTL